MHKRLFVSIFIILLLGRIYSYFGMVWNISDYGIISFDQVTNFITAGSNYISLAIGLYLAFNSKYKNVVINEYKLSYVLVSFTVAIWFIISLFNIDLVTILYTSTTPFVYLNIFLAILGYDERYWGILKKMAPIMAVTYLAIAIGYYVSLEQLLESYNLAGNTPIMTYFVSGFWWVAISIVDIKNSTLKYRVFLYVMILACALIAFCLTSRSWMIQSALLLVITLLQSSKTKVDKFVAFICISYGVFIIGSSIAESSIWSNRVEAFNHKLEQDTRTFQYEEMFDQVSLETWILGGGIDASYKSATGGSEYRYIDNQLLFTLFHYGIFLFLPYFFIWISIIMRGVFRTKVKFKDKTSVYVCALWILALAGLSVYNVIVLNSQNFILAMLLGRSLYVIKQKKSKLYFITR